MSAENFPTSDDNDAEKSLDEITLETLETELKDLMASWEFAFAFGHGCSNGDHPQFQATRDRFAHLRARIAEFKV